MSWWDRYRGDPTPAPSRRGLIGSAARVKDALTSAAVVIGDPGSGADGKPGKREAWQGDLWGYYDDVGEFHYSANFIANCLYRVRLRAGWLGDDDKVGPVYDDEDNVVEGLDQTIADLATTLIRQLKSPRGGQPAMLSDLGKNLSVAADCYMLGQDVLGTPDETGQPVVLDRSWEVLSTDELKPDSTSAGPDKPPKWKRHRTPGGSTGEDVPSGSRVIRVWRRHPRYSAWADSAGRPLIDILEELVLLTRTVRATATSRLAGAGVYWIPSEIEFPPDPNAPEGSEDDEPFTRQLIEVMTTPIKDRGSAASVVPMVARAAGDLIAKIRYDRFDAPDDSLSILKRTEAVQRLANGLDLPMEVVTGQGGANHWSAWQIDESTFKAHIEPLLELIVDALTVAYLQPGLRAARGLQPGSPMPEDIARVRVWYDATELVIHPNQEASADTGYGTVKQPNFLVKAAAWRRVNGFTEADAPDEEEILQRIQWAQAVGVRESVQETTAPTGEGDPAQGAGDVQPGPPAEPVASDANLTAAGRRLALELAVSTEYAIERAVDRCGSRLRSKLNGKATPELREVLQRTANIDVARTLGPQTVAGLIARPDLFTGEFDTLGRMIRAWARNAGAGARGEALAVQVGEAVEAVAAKRLFDPAARLELLDVLGWVASALT